VGGSESSVASDVANLTNLLKRNFLRDIQASKQIIPEETQSIELASVSGLVLFKDQCKLN